MCDIIHCLVYYGHFTPEYVESMKVFERDYYVKKVIEAKKADEDLQIKIHGYERR